MRFFWLFLASTVLTACGESGSITILSSSSSTNDSTSSKADAACQTVSYDKIAPTSTASDRLNEQWYLQTLGVMDSLWGRLINAPTASSIEVAVLDQRIDYNHPDLYANLNFQKSCHFTESTNLSKPTEHATEVAGIIAADNQNQSGINGIATQTKIRGFNILNSQGTATEWSVALGAQDTTQAEGVDIFNQSYGYPIPDSHEFVSYATNSVVANSILSDAVKNRRSGKGALYFKAAGNFFEFDASNSPTNGCSTYIRSLPYENANMDPDNNIAYNIVVGSVDNKDKRACYSASGSSLFFVAPGNGLLATTPNNQYGLFSGTSAATPVASGVAALILERYPDLGWRDVRHIMLASAEQVDSSIPAVSLILGDGTYIAEPSWQTNGAGYRYHNWYGFGRINATKALTLAAGHSNLPALQIKTGNLLAPNQTIADNSMVGANTTASVADSLIVESVQLSINLTHTRLADLAIELTSPSGMRSVLLTPRNGYVVPSQTRFDFVLISQAFYGEKSSGDWTLKVVDTQSEMTGTLNDWTMTLYGHAAN